MSGVNDLQKDLTDFQKKYNEYLDLTEKALKGQPKEVRATRSEIEYRTDKLGVCQRHV